MMIKEAKKKVVKPEAYWEKLTGKKNESEKIPLSKKFKEEDHRIPTGIPNFDSLIEGGFERNSTNLIVGGPGSGKTIFATQYLLDGLKKGENCLYITFEENKTAFYHNMSRFGWDLESYEKKGLFSFLIYTPTKVKSMLEEGGGVIESIVIKNKITRLVIDSMTSFTLLFNDELEKREASLELFNMVKKWNCTSLVTFEGMPFEDQKAYRTLEFEADAIILVHFVRKKIARERYIEILKMRGTNHSNLLYKYEILTKGIQINKKPVKKGE